MAHFPIDYGRAGALEDGASPDESPADTESNYGNNNSHDSDD